MNTLSVDICYRPLRIGWAVRQGDLEGFRKIVRLNTALWGGQFNPILVVDQDEHARQLVDLYRVDMIFGIDESDEIESFIKSFPRVISSILFKTVIVNDKNDRAFSYALDIQNALVHHRDKPEWREIREHGFSAVQWQENDPLADSLLARFGDYPSVDETGIDYRDIVVGATDAVDLTIEPDQPLPGEIFARPGFNYLSRYGLEPHYSIRSRHDSPGFFVGDSSDFDDLVCFWNLRAVDIPLFFIDPNFVSRYTDVIPAWIAITEKLVSHRRPEGFPAFSVWSREEITEETRGIFGNERVLQNRVNEASWNGLNLCPPMMHFAQSTTLGVVGNEFGRPSVSFPLSEKPFCGDSWFHTQQLVASVSFLGGLYGDDQHTLQPPYLPELNEFFGRSMSVGYDKFRIEFERVGLIIGASDHNERLTALPVAGLIEQVFNLAGFNSKPSSAGLITRQLVARLGGLQGGRPFKIPGVRRLLRTYGPTKSFTSRSALQLIGGPDPQNPDAKFEDHKGLYVGPRERGTSLQPKDVFRRLVEKSLFRIGVDLLCPSCRMESWISVDDLKQHQTCDLCGNEYDATSQLVSENWHYRRSGVLGREKNAQGAIPVALTLQQLDTTLTMMDKGVYSTSLDLEPSKDEGLPRCEVDFVWLIPRRYPDRTDIILAECKDQGLIDITGFRSDIEHLKVVADALPRKRFRAFVLYSKLSPFTPDEIEVAKALNGKYESRVILLTDRELDPYFIYERTKKDFDIDGYASSPDRMADTTAKIYFSKTGGESAILFDGNDKEYLRWLQVNSEGFVVNIRRRNDPSYAVLHRADCSSVSRYKNMESNPGGFTERANRKICALSTSDIEAFFENFADGSYSISSACTRCGPM